ncbi:MAG: AI-2E family transporter [Myxococcota bacterium]
MATVAIIAVGFLLFVLRGALTPVFFAFLIAYMLDPVIDRFEERGHSRAVGIGVMLTVVLGGLGIFCALALPVAIRDLAAFFRELPTMVGDGLNALRPWLDSIGVPVPHSINEAVEEFQLDMGSLAKEAAPSITAMVKSVLGGTWSVIGALAGLLLVPVFAAYLLYDFDRITAGIGELVPRRYRALVVEIAKDVDEVLGEFIRGQLIVMLILAVLYSVSYGVLGVRLAVLIGVVAGLLSFIPYVGGGVALGLGVLMALLGNGGWGQLLGVVIAYTIIQVAEGFFITPRVVGEKVGLSAVWVLFALLVGGQLFGFMGVLLALPAAAVIKIFVVRGVSWYTASEFFLGTDDDEVDEQAPAASDDEPAAAEDESAEE